MPSPAKKPGKYALVTGSMNLDVISSSADREEIFHRKGTTQIHFGGAGRNVAVNLTQLGAPVRFMTVTNGSPITRLSSDDLTRHGIQTHLLLAPETPDSIFSGHIFHGELISSIGSTPIEDITFNAEFVRSGLDNVRCVLASATHTIESLQNILTCANALNIPFYLAGDSAERSLKIFELQGQISGMFIDEGEANALLNASSNSSSWQGLAKELNTKLIITSGPRPVNLCLPGAAEAELIPITERDVSGNSLGAGDFLFGASVFQHEFLGKAWPDAIAAASRDASALLHRHHTHIGESEALALNIKRVLTQAETDTLTGIFNRVGLETFITQENLENQRLTAAVIDIDHFKKINDTYGHNAGDSVLKSVAKCLKEAVRQGDAVGRWGGEEFVVIAVNTAPQDLAQVINRFRENISELKLSAVNEKQITVSAGIAASTAKEDFLKTVEAADQALYAAKENGRNRVEINNR